MTTDDIILSITLTVNAIDSEGRHVAAATIPLPEELLIHTSQLTQVLDSQLVRHAARLRNTPDLNQRTLIEQHISEILTIYTLAGQRLAAEPF